MKIFSKKSGTSGAADMLPIIITTVFCGILIIYFSNHIKYLDVCNSVNNLAREYILKMESTRGLTENDKDILLNELDLLGVTTVSLEGTTMHDRLLRPGDDINLSISCVYNIQGKKSDGLLNINIPGVAGNIKLERNSVCLR